MDPALKNFAEAGDIKGLYSLIKQDHSILDGLDKLHQFDDTPLHIAARTGKADFAMEIANLKPSLARKLNEDGLSPMHLALEKKHSSIARGLVRIDKEVVRVKGRGGRTPLHEVASIGNSDLLKVFLDACPASVEDTTVQLETALHLALKSSKWEAFLLLLESLRKQDKSEILSWGDNHGNTVLHVATTENKHKFVKKLLWRKDFKVNHINTEEETALDILLKQGKEGHKLERPFRHAGALKSGEILSDKSGIVHARAEIQRRFFSWNFISYFRYNPYRDSPGKLRKELLVVVALIATATYDTGINPPAHKWQNKFKPDHHNSTIAINGGLLEGLFGQSVKDQFYYKYLFLNSLGFYLSLAMLMILTMGFPLQILLVIALLSMVANYGYSMWSIAPQGYLLFLLFGYVFPIFGTFTYVLGWEVLQNSVSLAWKTATRLIHRQDPAADVEPQANHV